MIVTTLLFLLAAFATLTSLATEAIKDFLDFLKIRYATNIVVLIIALLIGSIGTSGYYITAGIEFTSINIMYIFVLGIANWIGAMVGYDKVKQAIDQLGK